MYSSYFEEIYEEVEEEMERAAAEDLQWDLQRHSFLDDDDGDDDDDDISGVSDNCVSCGSHYELRLQSVFESPGDKRRKTRRRKNKQKEQKRHAEEAKKRAGIRLKLRIEEQKRQAKLERERLEKQGLEFAQERRRLRELRRIEGNVPRLSMLNFGGEIRQGLHTSLKLVPFAQEENTAENCAVQKVVDAGLVGFAMAKVMGSVYIHGGVDRCQRGNSATLKFDPPTSRWSIVDDSFPVVSRGHFLGQMGQHLLVFITNNTAYALDLSSSSDIAAPLSSISLKSKWRRIITKNNDRAMKRVTDFASCQIGADIFIHGGLERGGDAVAQFFRVEIKCIHDPDKYTADTAFELSSFTMNSSMGWENCPKARYKHAAVMIQREIIKESMLRLKNRLTNSIISAKDHLFVIFGGKGSFNVRLHDMWAFSTFLNQWIEVDQIGALPPPMHSFSMWASADNRTIYIHGGIVWDEEKCMEKVSNSIYRFELETIESSEDRLELKGRWKVVNVQGTPTHAIRDSAANRTFSMRDHKSILINNKTVIALGSDINDEGRLKCILMNDIDDMGIVNETTQWLWQCFRDRIETDIIIKSVQHGGETDIESEYLHCHRCVLAARSPKFRQILSALQTTDHEQNDDQPLVLEIKDFSTEVVFAYLQFLYTGTVNLMYSDNVEQLVLMSKEYGHYEVMEHISAADSYVYIDSHANVMGQLMMDLASLLDDAIYSDASISCCNMRLDTDVRDCDTKEDSDVMNSDSLNDILSWNIPSHRVFISRSPHIRRCLGSGMEESITGTIHFEDMSEKSMRSILYYLYTGSVQIGLESVVEVLISSDVLQLPSLQEYCRKILHDSITEENVFDILLLVDLYNDEQLRRRCVSSIVNKTNLYESIRDDPDKSSKIDEHTQRQLAILYTEREKYRINKLRREQLQQQQKKDDERRRNR